MNYEKYDDIRPLLPHEVPAAIETLLSMPVLRQAYEMVTPDMPWEGAARMLEGCDSVDEFKRRMGYYLVKQVMKQRCSGVALDTNGLDPKAQYTFISNHRDIILDSAFLNVLLHDAGFGLPQIAIGDNLMLQPWVETLVKLNGSFLVRRNLEGREVLLAAKKLSEYMHDAAAEGINLWIAQREGRAKDSSDRTQPALLKMLSIGGKSRNLIEALSPLNIVPVTCSYEYDPCDYLKAWEMQMKRDLPTYRKSKAEDGLNMATGVLGYKGRVEMRLGRPLVDLVAEISWEGISDKDLPEAIALLIDKEIHRGYTLYPCNYIAWDTLEGNEAHQEHYSTESKKQFDEYLAGRIAKTQFPEGIQKDEAFLRTCLLEMYANPAINYTKALEA